MSSSTPHAIDTTDFLSVFYSCGLKESAAAEAAEDIKPEELHTDPSWALYYYWMMRHDPEFLGVRDSTSQEYPVTASSFDTRTTIPG